ncbi:MAG: hypothetical protein J3Q66DRAFT_369 [Benniella sp.]|nr:MAG: hypothetical protein J3Q66DRAFT_369 [Benniella sp.]
MDKENNLNVGKSRHPAQPSSRSLYTYFSKPTATFTKPAVQAVDHVETKREPLKDASTLPTKREPLKDPNTLPTKRAPPPAKLTPFFDNPATKDPPPPAPQKQSSPHNSFTVVVETKSRFFGHEATVSSGSEALEDSRKRSCPSREDSGIGLDETYLLHGSEADGCLSGQEEFSAELSASKTEESRPKSKYRVVSMTREPSHPHSSALTSPAEDDFTFELKKAEAKVIQGWREKFSNPSGAGAGAGRTPGLTRANQASLYLSKSTPSLPPTFRLKQQQERSTNGPRQGGGVGVVRMAAGHPPYHLGMTRPLTGVSSAIAGKGVYRSSPSMDRMSASQDDGSELQGAPVHHDGLDALNLDRFKYTP